MQSILSISQIIISIALIAAIILQQRGAGGSAIFGGGGGGADYYTKRGFEKILFISTIVLSCLFILTAFVNLLI
jgi:protein translocase SecG subunit